MKVQSAHFTVISNGSEKDGRDVAAWFEEIRAVFSMLVPGIRTDPSAETIVIAVKNANTFDKLLPREKKGDTTDVGQTRFGREKNYMLLRLDLPYQSNELVYREYIYELLRLNLGRLPAWLEAGLAEFYGNTAVRKDDILIGAPSPAAFMLQHATLYPLRTVLSIEGGFPRDTDKKVFLNAESWGLTDFLMLGDGMGEGQKMGSYIKLLEQKVDSIAAFEQVFGKPEEVQKAFQAYVARYTFPTVRVKKQVSIDTTKFTSGSISDVESDAALGGFATYMGENDLANQLLSTALAADPRFEAAHETMGLVDFQKGDDEAALREFDKALELAPNDYLALYYDAMLRYGARNDTESLASLDGAAQRVLQLNPQFAPALAVRSNIYAKEGKLQDAYNVAVLAQRTDPYRGGYLTHVAAILLMGKNYHEAAKVGSEVISGWSGIDGAEALAIVEAAERLGNIEPTASEKAEDAKVMKYTEGTTAVSGVIKSVACQASKPLHLVLTSGGKDFDFDADGQFQIVVPDTLWYGLDHFNPCHHLEGVNAVVRYKLSKVEPSKSELEWLEIRDQLLPATVTAN